MFHEEYSFLFFHQNILRKRQQMRSLFLKKHRGRVIGKEEKREWNGFLNCLSEIQLHLMQSTDGFTNTGSKWPINLFPFVSPEGNTPPLNILNITRQCFILSTYRGNVGFNFSIFFCYSFLLVGGGGGGGMLMFMFISRQVIGNNGRRRATISLSNLDSVVLFYTFHIYLIIFL